MSIPLETLNQLSYGKAIAAELPASDPNRRAYIMVIPQAPSIHEHPEAWLHSDRIGSAFAPTPVLRDPALITGYEIRYLEHDAKYTDTEWGNDYDCVLDDETTRARRVFVQNEDEIEAALSPWPSEMEQLRAPQHFDSSLVNSPITGYLNRAEERPHLWL